VYCSDIGVVWMMLTAATAALEPLAARPLPLVREIPPSLPGAPEITEGLTAVRMRITCTHIYISSPFALPRHLRSWLLHFGVQFFPDSL
jgi:hypothetical protein